MKAVYSKCVHLLADDLYNTLNFNNFGVLRMHALQ